MRRFIRFTAWSVLVLVAISSLLIAFKPDLTSRTRERTTVAEGSFYLPSPKIKGLMTVEEAISRRRSIREYADEPLTLSQLSQVLWAAQGITNEEWKLRAAPSAGATYPFEIYVVVSRVDGLKPGIYKYDPYSNSLTIVRTGDFMNELGSAALDQEWVKRAAVDLVLVAFYERTTQVYGDRGQYIDHGTLGYISFGFMSLAMISGAFLLLLKRYKHLVLLLHLFSSLAAYISMLLTIWIVR